MKGKAVVPSEWLGACSVVAWYTNASNTNNSYLLYYVAGMTVRKFMTKMVKYHEMQSQLFFVKHVTYK